MLEEMLVRGKLPWWFVVILGWFLIAGEICLALIVGVSSSATQFLLSIVIAFVAWTGIVVMLPGWASSHNVMCRRLLEWGPLVLYFLVALYLSASGIDIGG
jgi:hypothetical protein